MKGVDVFDERQRLGGLGDGLGGRCWRCWGAGGHGGWLLLVHRLWLRLLVHRLWFRLWYRLLVHRLLVHRLWLRLLVHRLLHGLLWHRLLHGLLVHGWHKHAWAIGGAFATDGFPLLQRHTASGASRLLLTATFVTKFRPCFQRFSALKTIHNYLLFSIGIQPQCQRALAGGGGTGA